MWVTPRLACGASVWQRHRICLLGGGRLRKRAGLGLRLSSVVLVWEGKHQAPEVRRGFGGCGVGARVGLGSERKARECLG